MLKITNGIDIFEVTRGAFNGIYSKQGYTVVGGASSTKEVKVAKDDTTDDDTADDVVDASAGAPSDDEIFCSELQEKPIAQWNKNEVKKFAELKGIDISGTKNANEAKDIIKEFLSDSDEEEE